MLLLALALLLAGCAASPALTPPSTLPPGATPEPVAEQTVREAFHVPDPLARRAAVLSAVGSFLQDSTIRAVDDRTASSLLTDTIFASGQITLTDPAFVRRSDDLAVVGLPQGYGLYFYDLAAPASSAPLEISRWTVGLSAMDVIWKEDQAGVGYLTTGTDSLPRVHYALVVRMDDAWHLAWLSDEDPGWWLNASGGALSIASDLSRLTVTGEAPRTTEAFYEHVGGPRRVFRVTWERTLQGYTLAPGPEDFALRQAWLWQAAIPAPYATLVEFVERLQMGDHDGAAALAADPALVEAAVGFGLQLPERRYQVIEAEADRIVFRDVQGTFVAAFARPRGETGPWQIIDLAPYGAAGQSGQP